MPIEFRCEKCGKLLSVEAEPNSKVRCPYCKGKVTIPAGLAAMPRPQVPPGAARPAAPSEAQPEEPLVEEPDALMGVMATVMPWVISVFFHVGVFVILGFFAIVVFATEPSVGDTTIPDSNVNEPPGGRVNPGQLDPDLEARSLEKFNLREHAQRDATITSATLGETDSKISVIGLSGGSGGGPSADFGLTAGGSGSGPRSRFFGTGGSAYHIVYVVDRSGSMLETLDLVKGEMKQSIGRLTAAQTFHVIFFAAGEPLENPPRRLVYASEKWRLEALDFLEKIKAQGRTEPVPALEMAFKALQSPPNAKKGKLIYLLTDGEFPDNEAVLRRVRELNKRRDVYINTILHHHKSRPAMEVLRKIAEENGGRFKFVPPD